MWSDDKMQGHGKFVYPNGDVYEGIIASGEISLNLES